MDITVLRRISELIDEENELRSTLQRTKPAPDAQLRRLRQVEAQLDQCWAQLRQGQDEREGAAGLDDVTPSPINENGQQR